MPDADQDLRHGPARRIARNAALRAGGEVVGKLASLAFFVAMARKLGQDGFGDFVFALSLSTVLVLASGFGTEELVAREVARDRDRVHGYLADVVAVKIITSLVLLGLGAFAVNAVGYDPNARAAYYIIGIGAAAENLGRTWHSVFTAYERLELISVSLILQRTVTAAVGIAVLLAGGGLLAVAVVFTLGAFAGLLTASQVLRRHLVAPRWKFDRERWLPLLKAGIPIGIAGTLMTILLRADAALLGVLVGSEDSSEVGIYGAAFRLVEGTLFISWAFSTAMLPWIARQHRNTDVAPGYELGLKAITSVLMPIALVFALLPGSVIDLLYGAGYTDAELPLQLLSVMIVAYGISSVAATVMIARDRPQKLTRILLIVVVENIGLNLLLIPRYGADAAAFNAALSGLLLAVLTLWVVTRHVGAISVARAFIAPVAGGLCMAAAVMLTNLPLVPAAALGVLAYGVALLIVEKMLFPEDFGRLRGMLPARARRFIPA